MTARGYILLTIMSSFARKAGYIDQTTRRNPDQLSNLFGKMRGRGITKLQGNVREGSSTFSHAQKRPGRTPPSQLGLGCTTQRLTAKPSEVRDRYAITTRKVLKLFPTRTLLQQKTEQLITLTTAQMPGESSIGHITLQRKAEIPGFQARCRPSLATTFAQHGPGLASSRPHPSHAPLIDKKLQFEKTHLRQREHPGTSTEHLQPGT